MASNTSPNINGKAYTYVDHAFDVVVVGAGGAGLPCHARHGRAGPEDGLHLQGLSTRSHTVAAQGGIAASLTNMTPDCWQWHLYDTVKGFRLAGRRRCHAVSRHGSAEGGL